MVTLYTYDDVAQLNIVTIIPQGIRKKAKSVNIAGSYSCSMHETCMRFGSLYVCRLGTKLTRVADNALHLFTNLGG